MSSTRQPGFHTGMRDVHIVDTVGMLLAATTHLLINVAHILPPQGAQTCLLLITDINVVDRPAACRYHPRR